MDCSHSYILWSSLMNTLSINGSNQVCNLHNRGRSFNIPFVSCLILLLFIPGTSKAIVEGGPNDFYDSDPWTQQYLRAVDSHHLGPAEEQAKKGFTTSSTGARIRNIWEEIDFTLRWFPNHPNGLDFMSRTLPKYPHPPDKNVEYYFQKAIEYRPTPKPRPVDAIARLIYAIYLHKNNQYEKALKQYESALSIDPENSEIHYNLGLLLVKMKDYPRALEHGEKAYELGFPLPGLKNKLKKAGIWDKSDNPKQ